MFMKIDYHQRIAPHVEHWLPIYDRRTVEQEVKVKRISLRDREEKSASTTYRHRDARCICA